jgi:glucokinase
MLLLAIDIGGTKHSVALVNERGQIVKKQTGATKRLGGAEWMIERVLDSGGAIIGSNVVSSCGIGFGGPVDFAAQKVLSSTHVPGWEDVALAAVVEDKLGLPAVVENDANAGALGEYLWRWQGV